MLLVVKHTDEELYEERHEAFGELSWNEICRLLCKMSKRIIEAGEFEKPCKVGCIEVSYFTLCGEDISVNITFLNKDDDVDYDVKYNFFTFDVVKEGEEE